MRRGTFQKLQSNLVKTDERCFNSALLALRASPLAPKSDGRFALSNLQKRCMLMLISKLAQGVAPKRSLSGGLKEHVSFCSVCVWFAVARVLSGDDAEPSCTFSCCRKHCDKRTSLEIMFCLAFIRRLDA